MAARKGARWLAPIALAATIAAIYIVVHRGVVHSHAPGGSSTTRALLNPTSTTSTRRSAGTAHHARYYVVKAGDTLSAISAQTHVSLATIESLNPNVNPDALQTGQRLLLQR